MGNASQVSADLFARVPVVILIGFLGSGKTTLLRNLIYQSHKKEISVSVVVNDMSELDVDGVLVANTEVVSTSKNNFASIHSCVLSSIDGMQQLSDSLAKMLSENRPELLIIETSGSCHPLPLIDFFRSNSDFSLTGVLALADSQMLAQDFNFGQLLVPRLQVNLQNQKRDMVNLLAEQIMFCSHLLLTKADKVEKGEIANIARSIHPINPYVAVLSLPWGNLPLEKVMAMPEYNFHRVSKLIDELKPVIDSESTGERPYNMTTRVIKDDRPFHPQRLWDTCNHYLGQKIYRSKGFFWLASRRKMSLLWSQSAGSINLELVGYWRSGILEDENHGLTEVEVEQTRKKLAKESGRFGDRRCNLTVIGDKAEIDIFTNALESCFLTEEEIKHWESGGSFTDPWPKNIVKLQSLG